MFFRVAGREGQKSTLKFESFFDGAYVCVCVGGNGDVKVDPDVCSRTNLVSEVLLNLFISPEFRTGLLPVRFG